MDTVTCAECGAEGLEYPGGRSLCDDCYREALRCSRHPSRPAGDSVIEVIEVRGGVD